MARSNLDRLNAHYRNELENLRSAGAHFSDAYPAIASELTLSEGVARDPHVEQLIQSFAWMMGRLRMQMDVESRKVPSMLLEELAPSFLEPRPPMAIVECDVNGSGAEFSRDLRISEGQTLLPLGLEGRSGNSSRLKKAKFTVPYSVQLWPFAVRSVAINSSREAPEIDRLYSQSKSAIQIKMLANEEARLDLLRFDQPLRFFISGESGSKKTLYDWLTQNVIGVVISDESGSIKKALGKDGFRVCGFSDDEKMSALSGRSELGTSGLEDYFAFEEKFMFFELVDLQDLDLKNFKNDGETAININLVFKDLVPTSANLNAESFKLNCFPVVNLFDQTSEPVVLHQKNYRYRLVADRALAQDIEVQKIDEVYAVDKNGLRQEVKPYFAIQDPNLLKEGLYWVMERQEGHRNKTPGSEIWISVFSAGGGDVSGLSIFASTKSNNRLLCEQFRVGDRLGVLGAAPVKEIRFVTRPTRYCSAEFDDSALWKLMASLSRHQLALSQPESAKESLLMTLALCASVNDDSALRLMESIESVESSEDFMPSKRGGWRGYYRGTNYLIRINERLFPGSVMMFGRVILHFLSLFSHVNSFSSLEIYSGDRRLHKWPAMSGHKILA